MEHILFITGARRTGCTSARNILCNRLLPRRGDGPFERWEADVVDGILEVTARGVYQLTADRPLPATMNDDVKLLVIEVSGAVFPLAASAVSRVLGRYPGTPVTIMHMLAQTDDPSPESVLDLDAVREALQGREVIKNWGRICSLEGQVGVEVSEEVPVFTASV